MNNNGFEPEPEYGTGGSEYSLPRVSLKHKAPPGPYTSPDGSVYYTNSAQPPLKGENGISEPKLALSKQNRKDDDADSDDEQVHFEDMEWEPDSFLARVLHALHSSLGTGVQQYKGMIRVTILCIIFAAYNAYFIGSIVHSLGDDNVPIGWCDGVGFLIILTAIVYWSLFYYHVLKRFWGKAIYANVMEPMGKAWDSLWKHILFRSVFFLLIIAGLITFLVLDTKDNRRRLISAAGIPIILCIGLLISKHPARVVWRHIIWGTALQFLFGLLILRWQFGKDALQCISDKVAAFLKFSDEGSSFVYGFTATGFVVPPLEEGGDPVPYFGAFAFSVLPVIFYFSFIVAMLYHVGAMTWVVIKIGWLLQISMGTTACESMNASANIFLGQTEAPLVVKPFLNEMTNSELHAVMTGGFATIAGTVMGAFISFGVSPSHLLSASFMSAPAALALAKLIHPETKVSRTTSEKIYELTQTQTDSKKSNFLDAASEGASQAVHLVANIVASLIAIVAFVALLNAMLAWFGGLIGFEEFSFNWLLEQLFYPFAFIIGIDTEELNDAAFLLGMKTVINEFVAYERLTHMELSPRTKVITTYALCCFANFSSIGIQLGGLGALAPKRRKDLAKCIWRAFIAGNFAALMTACIAGTLSDEMGYSEWQEWRQLNNETSPGRLSMSITANLF